MTIWGDDRARQVLAVATADDPSELERLVLGLRDDAWDDRAFYVDALGAALPLAMLDGWCEGDPDSALAFLLRGRRLIELAWDVRGGAVASDTDRRKLVGFEEWLAAAEGDLRTAIDLDATDPTPHVHLLTVLQGTGRAATGAAETLAAIRERAPTHFAGHHAMLRASTLKWGGSHEQMFAVAREGAARGGLLPLLVPGAHLERWIFFMMQGERSEARGYGADPTVRTEIANAVQAAHASGLLAAGHPRCALAANVVAFWAFLVHDRELLQWAIGLVDAAVTSYPWLYLDGMDTFEEAKRAAR